MTGKTGSAGFSDTRFREATAYGGAASGVCLASSLHHPHFHAALGHAPQRDVVHEVAHQEDAAPARLQHVLGRQRIGELLGIEAFAFVADAR